MSKTALTQRYAQAFCSLAHDKGNLEDALEVLETLADAFEPALGVIFSNPDVSQEERHELIDKAFSVQSDRNETVELVRKFCKLLVDKNRFRYFQAIVDACRDEADRLLGRKRAHVETPFELEDPQKSRLNQQLAEQFDAEVLLDQEVSEDLLAGLRVQVDDYLMNYSIRNQLEELYGKFRRST